MLSIARIGFAVIAAAGWCAAADTPLWEPGKVVAVEQVSTPAKDPDPSCRSIPKGATPPPSCRPSNLRAEQFWRVTLDVGNKRFVVRPYRAPKLLDSLNQGAADYVDPHVTAGSPVEVAILSTKTIRLRTDQGQGITAIVDSQALLSSPPVPVITKSLSTSSSTSTSKVVLLENGDFHDLEVQEFKAQDIGDGVELYSFPGDTSSTRIGSNPPVLLVLESDGNVELSRLQVGKGSREAVISKNRSASPVPVVVTRVSATTRKISIKEALPPGEYVLLLENSKRGFLFSVP